MAFGVYLLLNDLPIVFLDIAIEIAKLNKIRNWKDIITFASNYDVLIGDKQINLGFNKIISDDAEAVMSDISDCFCVEMGNGIENIPDNLNCVYYKEVIDFMSEYCDI
jgi:hypothetical protein